MRGWFLLCLAGSLAACGSEPAPEAGAPEASDIALVGEGRRGALSVSLPKPISDIAITEALI